MAAGLAERCVIQLSYAIGVPEPLSIYANCDGTEKCDLAKLEKRLGEVMDLRPRGIRTHLGLNKPIYARTSAYGHFGREPDKDGGFSWEKKAAVLRPGSLGSIQLCDPKARKQSYDRLAPQRQKPRPKNQRPTD